MGLTPLAGAMVSVIDWGFASAFAGLLGAGFACGLAMSAPVGPMAMLSLIKIAENRIHEARAIGMGTAMADAALAAVVCWGVAAVGRWLAGLFWDSLPARLTALAVAPKVIWSMAAAALVLLAVQIAFFEKKQSSLLHAEHRSWWLVGFGGTLGNPGNFVAFMVWFGWLSGVADPAHGLLLRIVPPFGVLGGALCIWAVFLFAAPRLLRWLPMDKVVAALRYALAGMLLAIAATALRHALAN